MNVELADILTIVGTLGGIEAIKWGANFFANRKTNARIEDAHADAEEFKEYVATDPAPMELLTAAGFNQIK